MYLEMVDINDMNTLFRSVDPDGSGFIDKDKLQRICPHLSSADIDTIFEHFDSDHDNRLTVNDLLQAADNSPFLSKGNDTHSERHMDTDDVANEVFNQLHW